MDPALQRTAAGWDDAADGYERYFVPRFAPWVAAAVDALGGELPDGPVLVPCCGTFPELDVLQDRYPGRELVGIDLSAGMLAVAATRSAGRPEVTLVEGDASALDPRWSGRCAAVLSVFGLQQLPEPEQAVGSWVGALRPGGRLSVVFWPSPTEAEGPFARVSRLVAAHRPPADTTWQDRVAAAVTSAGGVLDRDEQPSFPITHPDAETFFDAYSRSGPLRVLLRARGEELAARLRADFLRDAPAGPWRHSPRARLVAAHAAGS